MILLLAMMAGTLTAQHQIIPAPVTFEQTGEAFVLNKQGVIEVLANDHRSADMPHWSVTCWPVPGKRSLSRREQPANGETGW